MTNKKEEQPVKRGPGRPPGSGSKHKNPYNKKELTRFANSIKSRDKLDLTAEECSLFTKNAMEIANLPRIDITYPDSVQRRVNEYFTICQSNDLRPNIAGLSLSLHMDRQHLIDICNGKRKAPAEVVDILTQARRILNNLMEDYQMNNAITPVSGIFLSKNNFGYKDSTDVVISNDDQFGAIQDAKTLRDKYLTDIVDDDINN